MISSTGTRRARGRRRSFWAQFDPAEIATEALGIVTWPMTEFEADDAIATAAVRFADDPRVEQVVICSPDKDLTQVVRGDRIVSLDRRREILTNEAGVVEKFGVPPESLPDLPCARRRQRGRDTGRAALGREERLNAPGPVR